MGKFSPMKRSHSHLHKGKCRNLKHYNLSEIARRGKVLVIKVVVAVLVSEGRDRTFLAVLE